MALVNYIVQYDIPPGSYGVLIEYKEADTIDVWTVPTSPANPTMSGTYPLELEEGLNYYVRVSSQGKDCTSQAVIVRVEVPAP